jgi:hypothetical protein
LYRKKYFSIDEKINFFRKYTYWEKTDIKQRCGAKKRRKQPDVMLNAPRKLSVNYGETTYKIVSCVKTGK